MSDPVNRRGFVTAATLGVVTAGVSLADDSKPAEPKRDYPAPKFTPKRKNPKLPDLMVEDFVVFGHYDLKMVKTLLEKEPALLNAAVDWGAGDWETAMGGAAHMGNREIVEYLLSQGARMDLFAATALGRLDVVKGMLEASPELIDAKGPHGFDLYFHAKAGGDEAKAVYEFLTGIQPDPMKNQPPKKGKG